MHLAFPFQFPNWNPPDPTACSICSPRPAPTSSPSSGLISGPIWSALYGLGQPTGLSIDRGLWAMQDGMKYPAGKAEWDFFIEQRKGRNACVGYISLSTVFPLFASDPIFLCAYCASTAQISRKEFKCLSTKKTSINYWSVPYEMDMQSLIDSPH